MDIEAVAEDTPEAIISEPIDVMLGLQPEQTLRVAKELGFAEELIPEAQKQMSALYDLFIGTDATQARVPARGALRAALAHRLGERIVASVLPLAAASLPLRGIGRTAPPAAALLRHRCTM